MALRQWTRDAKLTPFSAFVADSVTMQSVEALKGMLNLPSGNYKGNSNGWFQKATGSPLHQALFASNSTIALLAEALPHVPAERLRQPFAHLLRHDTLLDQAEMRPIAESLGLGGTFKFEGWLANSSWEEVLPKQAEKRWEGEQNSVLFFNTGAHWSLICLGLEKAGLGELARAVVSFHVFWEGLHLISCCSLMLIVSTTPGSDPPPSPPFHSIPRHYLPLDFPGPPLLLRSPHARLPSTSLRRHEAASRLVMGLVRRVERRVGGAGGSCGAGGEEHREWWQGRLLECHRHDWTAT